MKSGLKKKKTSAPTGQNHNKNKCHKSNNSILVAKRVKPLFLIFRLFCMDASCPLNLPIPFSFNNVYWDRIINIYKILMWCCQKRKKSSFKLLIWYRFCVYITNMVSKLYFPYYKIYSFFSPVPTFLIKF